MTFLRVAGPGGPGRADRP